MYFFFGTMDNNITYGRSYRWVSYELSFNKIETEATLEASLGMFWRQYWMLLVVSIDNRFYKFVHVCFSIAIHKQSVALFA